MPREQASLFQHLPQPQKGNDMTGDKRTPTSARTNLTPAPASSSRLEASLRALTLSAAAKLEAAAQLDDSRPPVALLARLAVSHRDPRVRTGAVIRLGRQGRDDPAAATGALRAAAHDPNRFVVARALLALKHLGAREALPDFVAALADSDFRVVKAAVEAIVSLGNPEHGAHLVPLLGREDNRVRLAALVGIQALNWPGAAPAVLLLLDSLRGRPRREDIDFNVPELCIRLLGGWRVMEAAPVLVHVVNGELGLRKKALDALERLGCPRAAAALIPTLARAHGDPHAKDLALKMLRLMARTGCRESLPAVRLYLSHPDRDLRGEAVEIVGAWRDEGSAQAVRRLCRDDRSEFVRPKAARALARILGPAAAPELARLAGEINPEVRRAVRESLEAMGPLPPEGAAALSGLSGLPPASAEGGRRRDPEAGAGGNDR